jgi:hypothetical protein
MLKERWLKMPERAIPLFSTLLVPVAGRLGNLCVYAEQCQGSQHHS